MSDIVERLRAEATDNRRYEVSGTLATEAADRIEQLEAALAMFVCDCTVSERCTVPDSCRNFKARRMLEEAARVADLAHPFSSTAAAIRALKEKA